MAQAAPPRNRILDAISVQPIEIPAGAREGCWRLNLGLFTVSQSRRSARLNWLAIDPARMALIYRRAARRGIDADLARAGVAAILEAALCRLLPEQGVFHDGGIAWGPEDVADATGASLAACEAGWQSLVASGIMERISAKNPSAPSTSTSTSQKAMPKDKGPLKGPLSLGEPFGADSAPQASACWAYPPDPQPGLLAVAVASPGHPGGVVEIPPRSDNPAMAHDAQVADSESSPPASLPPKSPQTGQGRLFDDKPPKPRPCPPSPQTAAQGPSPADKRRATLAAKAKADDQRRAQASAARWQADLEAQKKSRAEAAEKAAAVADLRARWQALPEADRATIREIVRAQLPENSRSLAGIVEKLAVDEFGRQLRITGLF